MNPMWQIVCIGPGPLDRPRRVVDRGPLLSDEQRANDFAAWLRSTGCYEEVKVVQSGAIKAFGSEDD